MKEILKQNKALKRLVREMSEVAGYLWQRGWAERNAGNISVNIKDLLLEEIPETGSYPFFELPATYPALAGSCFLVTGTGKRMRDLANAPLKNVLIITLSEAANSYQIISKKVDNGNLMPTSELATHLGIHQMIAERGSSEKVVLHAHVTELIALTHSKELCNEPGLNKLLWSMHPETIIFVPKGVGFVPYSLPGSADIALETSKALQNHDIAIWEKHGVFAIGSGLSNTFDIIDILAKSVRIFLMCRVAGIATEGFNEAQLAELKSLGENF